MITEAKKNQKHRKDQMLKKINLIGIYRIYGISQAINPVRIKEQTEVKPGGLYLFNIFIAGVFFRAHSPLGCI